MSYGNIYKIFILIAVILSVCLGMMKPAMHTNLMIYNSDYKVVAPEIEQEPIKVVTVQTELPKLSTETVKKSSKVIKTEPKTLVKPIVAQENKKIVSEQKVIKKNKTSVPDTRQITQEEIAWNIWRSNLQNQIMQDVIMPNVPMGTVFKFSFEVDKYGKISNVQTWSLDRRFTPIAIEHIAPVIRSYQGREILNFPVKSERTITKVEGGWKISDKSVYSTPNDYNDTEKVTK